MKKMSEKQKEEYRRKLQEEQDLRQKKIAATSMDADSQFVAFATPDYVSGWVRAEGVILGIQGALLIIIPIAVSGLYPLLLISGIISAIVGAVCFYKYKPSMAILQSLAKILIGSLLFIAVTSIADHRPIGSSVPFGVYFVGFWGLGEIVWGIYRGLLYYLWKRSFRKRT